MWTDLVLIRICCVQGDGGTEVRLREKERDLEIAREDARKAKEDVQKLKEKNADLQREILSGEKRLACVMPWHLDEGLEMNACVWFCHLKRDLEIEACVLQ